MQTRGVNRLGTSLILINLALLSSGCITFDKPVTYRSNKPVRETKSAELQNVHVTARNIAIVRRPTVSQPQSSVIVSVSETVSGNEVVELTWKEGSFKDHWSPIVIPFGLIGVAVSPITYLLDSAFQKPDHVCPGVTGTSFRATVGLSDECLENIGNFSYPKEIKNTGREVANNRPASGLNLKVHANAKVGLLSSKGEELTLVTSNKGIADISLFKLLELLDEAPRKIELRFEVSDKPTSSVDLTIDRDIVQPLYSAVGQVKQAREFSTVGHLREALEMYTKAFHVAFAEDSDLTVWRELTDTYRKLDVKPAESEEARRLLIQSEDLGKRGNHKEAIELLTQAAKLEPWNAAIHYNRAVLEGLENNYMAAITSMRRYVTLVPEASDTREAKDLIYRWEAAQK